MPRPKPQSYRPGSRKGNRFKPGKISENRYAWLRTGIGQFVTMYYEDNPLLEEQGEEESDLEFGPTVRLILPRQFGPPMKYNITALTFEELDMMRQFFNLLFDLAEPTVRERDRLANEAFEAGDDSYARIYRQVPQYIVRGRPVRADGQGVRDGHEDLPAGTGEDGDPSGGTGVVGGAVADRDEEVIVTEDDEPTDHQP